MTKETSISVRREESCRIVGGTHLADAAPLLSGESEICLVYDENVAWVAGELMGEVGASVRCAIAMDTSEPLKTMDTVLSVCRQLMEAGVSRKALLVAIGGGITTDLAGFAASIYKRGIRYANIPTTLLAQVDAGIGGKTGVNLDGYKNMLGVIVQPVFSFLCADTLKTLPPREFKAGLAELLKTFLLADASAYEDAIGLFSGMKTPGILPALQPLIEKAARIKAAIVQRDPYEQGERAQLNLGHTFAHAIEHEASQQGDDIRHGEAVAIGIILAARLSEQVGIAENGLADRLKADFAAIGLPTECPYPADALVAAMRNDKKSAGGKLTFVLPEAPGTVVLQTMQAPLTICLE